MTDEILKLFCTHIHQGFLTDFPDFFSGVTYILNDFTNDQISMLHASLTELNTSGYTNSEKVRTWENAGAQFSVSAKQISAFLDEILKTIEQHERYVR